MKHGRFLWAVVLIAISLQAGKYAPERSQTGVVHFPQLGDVRIEGKIVSHVLPQVIFTSAQSNTVLLKTTLGSGELNPKYIDTGPDADPFPIIRFKVLRLEGVATPLVFAATMHAGGSDCSYWGEVVGENNGKLAVLSTALPMVNAEGGYAIIRPHPGDEPEVVAWNFIWGEGESHLDPHAHWVKVYRLNSRTGKFVFIKKYVVPKTGPGVTLPNLLRQLTRL